LGNKGGVKGGIRGDGAQENEKQKATRGARIDPSK